MVVGAIKTLILGADGMLGSDLCRVFPDAIHFTHSDLDITNRGDVIRLIREIAPDVVINAAAYTNVDGCEDGLYC
jgi:dTDP-4-dehydrorhamnose reductase